MKKIFSFLTAILFTTAVMADTYGVSAVTSFVSGDKYVFFQSDHVIDGKIDNSKLLPLTTFAQTNLAGTESYVWTVEKSGDGWLLKSAAGTYLANESKGNLSLEATGTVWDADFSEGTLLLSNPSNADRFLALNADGTGYKTYAQQNLSTYDHEIVVYHLAVGATGKIGEDVPDPYAGDTINIAGLVYADAYYYEEEGDGYWDIDLYKNYNESSKTLVYPEVYFSIPAESKTTLAGEYELYYAGYWKSAKDSVEMDEEDMTAWVNITFDGLAYTFSGQFKGENGKTYMFTCTSEVSAYDYDNDYADIILDDEVTEGVEKTEAPAKATKVMKNGQLTIIKGDKIYHVNGAQVR